MKKLVVEMALLLMLFLACLVAVALAFGAGVGEIVGAGAPIGLALCVIFLLLRNVMMTKNAGEEFGTLRRGEEIDILVGAGWEPSSTGKPPRWALAALERFDVGEKPSASRHGVFHNAFFRAVPSGSEALFDFAYPLGQGSPHMFHVTLFAVHSKELDLPDLSIHPKQSAMDLPTEQGEGDDRYHLPVKHHVMRSGVDLATQTGIPKGLETFLERHGTLHLEGSGHTLVFYTEPAEPPPEGAGHRETHDFRVDTERLESFIALAEETVDLFGA